MFVGQLPTRREIPATVNVTFALHVRYRRAHNRKPRIRLRQLLCGNGGTGPGASKVNRTTNHRYFGTCDVRIHEPCSWASSHHLIFYSLKTVVKRNCVQSSYAYAYNKNAMVTKVSKVSTHKFDLKIAYDKIRDAILTCARKPT